MNYHAITLSYQKKGKNMIDKNITVPISRNCIYNFHEMQVGDSVFIKDGIRGCKQHAAFKMYCSRNGWKSCARKVEGGLRIWRLEK